MAAGTEQKLEATSPQSLSEIVSAWLPLALWIAAIQTFAGDGFAESSTSRFIGPMLRWLFPGTDQETLDLLHFGIRKSCHLLEYGLLALLARRAFGLGLGLRCKPRVLACLALVFVVAAVDESRQAASALRGGAISDVALDLSGAAIALLAASWFRRKQIFQRLGVMFGP